MKLILQNRTFSIALAVSLLLHGIMLLVHLVAPVPLPGQVTDPGLEVILVNARHDHKPLKAQALAQADLDGGGSADAGRAKSPLPDMSKSEDGDTIYETRRKIEELENLQEQLLDQTRRKTVFKTTMQTDKSKQPALQPDGDAAIDSSKALARLAAEISKTIEDQNKRPRKTYITPSTRAVGYAMYYKKFQERIERIGTLNFPQKNGQKLYGELIVTIPIFQDGSIYEKEGGPRVDQSSGNPALDSAALRIVRRSAPFGHFPKKMRSNDKDDLWIVVTRFKFTREQALETELKY